MGVATGVTAVNAKTQLLRMIWHVHAIPLKVKVHVTHLLLVIGIPSVPEEELAQ
jgi:hypothetical protein